ncbi:MAG: peptidylprolyl isomerase [Chthonomonadaceae bacterium]|jgi:cyclophilin family peptidyl-prolyl cis-trans isomerase|nr:peptidylprolyl isomerase [Chthonomonadaceae bacterium]
MLRLTVILIEAMTSRTFFLLLTVVLATLGWGQTKLVLDIENRGKVEIELYTNEAPKTTAQIIRLAQSGFYNGQKFFRVVKSPKPFLIQTGDPASKTKPANDPGLGSGGSGKSVPYEDSGHSNVEGAVGLSALPRDKNSGDSQFYILLGPAKFLDGSYTVFGRVVSGMDVVRAVELGDKVTSATIVRG